MRQILIVLVPILILQTGCGFNQNNNNVIYLPGRNFQYQVFYFDQDDTIRKIDSLVLEVTDGFYPQRSQTAIVWTHYQQNEKDTTIIRETTGVVDDPEYFFIHPPREGDLHILSFAEFPSIRASVFSDTMSRISSTGSITMAKNYKGKTITEVKTSQIYQGKTKVKIPFRKNYRAHHLKATAKSELGIIYGNYYFSEELGFVRMDYELPDNSKISIRLTKVSFEED